MTNYPKEFVNQVSDLPQSIDQAVLKQKGVKVVEGLTFELAEQLVVASREPHVVEYCPGDTARRFTDIDTIKKWQENGKLTLPLVRGLGVNTLKLSGFAWMGQGKNTAIDNANVTFAFRIYQEALGQANALPYLKVVLQAHYLRYGRHDVWLEAWSDNKSALRMYDRVGFEKVSEAPGVRHGKELSRVRMVLEDGMVRV